VSYFMAARGALAQDPSSDRLTAGRTGRIMGAGCRKGSPSAIGRCPVMGGLLESEVIRCTRRPWTCTKTATPFEPTSKRRRGYPSERAVKRGRRIVHGGKELEERLGKDDLCPCGSGRRFQTLLPQYRQI
jgi:hypothetical protein